MLHVELDVAGVTVSAIVVVAVSVPEVPVMVTVAVPAVAVPLAASVSTLVAVAGLVAKLAVTPLGRPDAVRVTLPANPFKSVTVMVLRAVRPWAIDTAGAEGVSVKVGVGFGADGDGDGRGCGQGAGGSGDRHRSRTDRGRAAGCQRQDTRACSGVGAKGRGYAARQAGCGKSDRAGESAQVSSP